MGEVVSRRRARLRAQSGGLWKAGLQGREEEEEAAHWGRGEAGLRTVGNAE